MWSIPKVDMNELSVVGVEALLRWKEPSGSQISPDVFIPLAEKLGLTIRMGAWVYRQAVIDLSELHKSGNTELHMSVNLSVAQLQHGDVLAMLKTGLDESGVNPRFIDLEVTESLAANDLHTTLALLHEIKAMGFTLSLDDFGTSFSSLNHLQKIPLDNLKLDKSLVEATSTERGKGIVEMIVQLAERLQLNVVAEGVENSVRSNFYNR
ncbi:MAG: EAL domain-containing protein (putative c-di-GMP-specific phosphodiesterase class I) [Lentisphaeria bacterium]|jgi:EAL domain-containing protein (putative c-di-GMP-specific phosphodiesterase class I)